MDFVSDRDCTSSRVWHHICKNNDPCRSGLISQKLDYPREDLIHLDPHPQGTPNLLMHGDVFQKQKSRYSFICKYLSSRLLFLLNPTAVQFMEEYRVLQHSLQHDTRFTGGFVE